MYQDEFYQKSGGTRPAEDWLNSLNPKEHQNVVSKMQMLRDEGLRLSINDTLQKITPITKKEKQDKNLYELICGSLRVGIYFDPDRAVFVYLHGWRKKKQVQPQDIQKSRAYMHDYIDRKGSN